MREKSALLGREEFERILDSNFSDIAIIFSFPGIGLGKEYCALSGCTLEAEEYERIARKYMGLGIDIIGISTGDVPKGDRPVKYLQLPEPCPPFSIASFDGNNFLNRESFFIETKKIERVKVDDVISHALEVERWIGKQLDNIIELGKCDNTIIDIKKNIISSKRLQNGADSLAIVSFKTLPSVVLKTGASKIIDLEAKFILDVNKYGFNIFPKIYSKGNLSSQNSFYLMEGGNPDKNIEREFFSSVKDGVLANNWKNKICKVLTPFRGLYRKTLKTSDCNVSLYHYTNRIRNIMQRSDFIDSYNYFDITNSSIDEFLNWDMILNGKNIGRFVNNNNSISESYKRNKIKHLCMIHGDLHIKNILYSIHKGKYLFIDPRLQWDDYPIDKFGYGDPVYDMSTMLHSLSCMSFILNRINMDMLRDVAVWTIGNGTINIKLSNSLINNLDAVDSDIVNICENILPSEVLEGAWENRLYAGAANAIFGWLKYAKTVKQKKAWVAIYALSAHYASKAVRK